MPSKLRLATGSFVSADNLADVTAQKESATIPTSAGAIDLYFTAPVTGTLAAAQITPLTALATSDTNYITWTITNLGLAGAGTTVMLATSGAGVNTTKATGGLALAVNTKRVLTPHATAANVAVVKGDRLKVTATVTGTLAGTVTVPTYLLSFTRSE